VFESSPTAADGRIYCLSHRGELFVVAADPEQFKLLATVNLGGENDTRVRSSVAIAGNRLFVRTDTTLFCVGAAP
jgi:outer membrane protein assembly factor BamB